jgi:predicted metal-dependent peptidase
MAQEMPIACKRAVTSIVTRHVFFASTLLRHPIQFAETVPTACITHEGKITINPRWSANFSVANFVFLLCHECLHHMMAHSLRRGKRDPKRWNWAGDAWINETLIADDIGTFIEGGVRKEGADHSTVERLYTEAPDDLPDGGSGGSLGDDLEVVDPNSMSEAERAERISQADVTLAGAAQAARMMGKLSASLERLVAQTLFPKTPWHKYLEQFMTKFTESDFAFHKPDESLRHLGINVPGLDGESCGHLAIVVDESGSIGANELAEFSGHLNRILEMCSPEEIHVLHTDTEVRHTESFTPDNLPITLTARAGGGTDMSVGVRQAVREHPEVDAIIVLTDGYTPFGSDPGVPVFWAITVDGIKSPYGESVHIGEAA